MAGTDNPSPKLALEPDPFIAQKRRVKLALKRVSDANSEYIEACRELSYAKINHARDNPHPWMGQTVTRIQKGAGLHNRAETGVVCFKEYSTPDYGNSHIEPGKYYVLVDGKTAHWLDESWQLDLL
jgi:hypothetical protein